MNRTLALTLLALAAATGAAHAANCPRGQIYRVSKQVCIDHDEAVKLGIIRGSAPRADTAKPEPDAAQEPAQDATPREMAAPEPPAVAAPPPEPTAAAAPEAAPEAKVKTVHSIRIIPPRPADAAKPQPAQAYAPANAEAATATPNPFGALDPGGVPMSQPR
jgi:outer membrane biosynthesis protein TonB